MRPIFLLSMVLLFAVGLADIGQSIEPPYFVECQSNLIVGFDNRIIHDFIAIDPDGDPLYYSLEFQPSWWPSSMSFNSTTGRLDTRTSLEDVGTHSGTVKVTDGQDTVECSFYIEVVLCGEMEFYIEGQFSSAPPKGLPGSQVEIDIVLNMTSEEIDGFDFLIGFDTEYLTFIGATQGNLLNTCEWEYFTYADESIDKHVSHLPILHLLPRNMLLLK